MSAFGREADTGKGRFWPEADITDAAPSDHKYEPMN